jgi:hypothetical protein
MLLVIAKMIPSKEPSKFDIDGFGRLPVLVGGRVMPMDTLARVSLFAKNHRGTYTTPDGRAQPQRQWLLEVLMPGARGRNKSFRSD